MNYVDALMFSFCWGAIQFRNHAGFNVTKLILVRALAYMWCQLKVQVAIYVQFRLGLIAAASGSIRAQFEDLGCIDM